MRKEHKKEELIKELILSKEEMMSRRDDIATRRQSKQEGQRVNKSVKTYEKKEFKALSRR